MPRVVQGCAPGRHTTHSSQSYTPTHQHTHTHNSRVRDTQIYQDRHGWVTKHINKHKTAVTVTDNVENTAHTLKCEDDDRHTHNSIPVLPAQCC